jgi:Putative Flp pilus-assembly TadE/G-like
MRSERGQSLVLAVIFMVVLLGMAALVLDVGSWYRADRKLQANADAAALAGAQALPEEPAAAQAAALDYADRNDGGVDGDDITVSPGVVDNDTITVLAERPAPGFFAQIFGLGSVTVRAKAVARAGVPTSARFGAPIGVDHRHPMLAAIGCPCYGKETELELNKVGPGAFRILNIDGSNGGTSSATLGEWIRNGLDADMPLGWYYSDPGASFNSSHVRDALKARFGTVILLPIYSEVRGSGAGFDYKVIGFAGFHVTGIAIHGSKSKIFGWFERVVWEGVLGDTPSEDDFGSRTIELIE